MYLVNTWYTKVVTRIYDSEESDDYTTPLTLKHNAFDSTSKAVNQVGERDDWEDRGEEAPVSSLLAAVFSSFCFFSAVGSHRG